MDHNRQNWLFMLYLKHQHYLTIVPQRPVYLAPLVVDTTGPCQTMELTTTTAENFTMFLVGVFEDVNRHPNKEMRCQLG